MGTVYLAEDTVLKRRVALKFLPPDRTSDTDAAARLLREARSASALDHPHIATVYEVGRHAGQPFIAMGYYEGETLATRIARAPMGMSEAARIIAQVADAVDAAHTAGIVHRDLKPSNLMLTTSGQVKVLDFGLAKIDTGETATQLTNAGTALGTVSYMSPEQAAGEPVDARTDLWSLGIVLYEMLAGRPPFKDSNALGIIQAVLTTSPTPIRTLRPDVAPELDEIVTRALVRNRERRTITAAGIRDLASQCAARLSTGLAVFPAQPRRSRRSQIAAAAISLVVAVAGLTWWMRHTEKVRWARREALPQIVRLADADKFDDAYRLARQVQPYLADDPLLAEQLRLISRRAVIGSDPVGGDVLYRPYGRSDVPWRPLGKTPVDVRVPRGLLHWKVDMPGYATAEDVAPSPFSSEVRLRLTLFPPNQVPAGMVRIASSGQPFKPYIPGLEHLVGVSLPDYWIDRHEVTNREFKRFVDDGGYQQPKWWQEPFVSDGRPLTYQAAMARFRDATGRPGPAGWELGTYPPGQDDYPVGGVSWYEAAAFARWAGKSLPTIYHWFRAADLPLSGDVVPASNFDGKALRPVGVSGGTTRGGTTDMAGNVKEWILNASGEKRHVLGSAWNEPVYMFMGADAQLPFTREAMYGFRCIKVDRPDHLSAPLTAAIPTPSRDVRRVAPVSASVFEAWRSLYSFDHGDLKAQMEAMDDSSPDWRRERVSYAAAYGDERIPAYLFLPKNAQPPYQVMIGFSGSNVFLERSSAATTDTDRLTFIGTERPRPPVPDLQEHLRAGRRCEERYARHDGSLS